MYAAYTLLYCLGLCALAPRALWHLVRGGRYGVALGARLGRVPEGLGQHRGAIWIHAVSVGEVHAARGLLPHLRRRFPATPVVLSTTTPTGQQIAGGAGADATFYLPLDLPFAILPYLRALRPRAILLVETELWPNLLLCAERSGIPVGVVNGRLSAASYRRYRRMRTLWPEPLRKLGFVCARTQVEALRYRQLGIASHKLYVTGNLKADAAVLEPPAQARSRLAQELGLNGSSPLIVAGCTMRDEEEKVLRAFRRVRQHHPDVRLLLAPRHPPRFAEVTDLVRRAGFRVRRRSNPGPPDADVIVLDTLGELPAAYGLATVSFVGGSLVPTGGHNLLEPAIQGQPILFGPHMGNFAAMAAQFERQHAGCRVADAEGLAAAVDALLRDPDRRRRLGTRARAVARADAAAGRRTAQILARVL